MFNDASRRVLADTRVPNTEATSRKPAYGGNLTRRLPQSEVRVSLIFSLAVTLVPWSEIHRAATGAGLWDREVYTRQILNFTLSTDLQDYDTVLSYITDEYGWGTLLSFLARQLGLAPPAVFFLISFFVISVSSLYVVRNASVAFLPLLIVPPFIDFSFSQMRMALALALAAAPLAFAIRRRWISVGFMLVAVTVHTAAATLLILYIGASLVTRRRLRISPTVQYAATALVGIAFGLVVGPLRQEMLGAIDDRRLETDYATSIPILLIIWLILGVLLTSDWTNARSSVPAVYSLSLFVSIPLVFLSQGYPDRYLGASIPIVVAGIHSLEGNHRAAAVIAYVFYFVVRWLYWLGVL